MSSTTSTGSRYKSRAASPSAPVAQPRKPPAATASREFSVPAARDVVRDLMKPQPWRYYLDFFVPLVIGYAAASVYLSARPFSGLQLVSFFVAGFALYRVGTFIHEIVHLAGRQLLVFRIVWNLLAGIPMLMPSFFYSNHIDHHSTKHYGTRQDGEYVPLGTRGWSEVVKFCSQVILLPIMIFTRFLVLTPISFLHPRLRRWVLERHSSFIFNWSYRFRIPPQAPRKLWATIEMACFLRTAAIPGLILVGLSPWYRLVQLYLLGVLALGLNYLRNLVAHRYESDGEPVSHVAQLEDTVNITGVPVLTELFFPLGLRYHALHHLFPTLPYHNLAKGHRRLMAHFAPDSPYHRTVRGGFWAAFRELVRPKPGRARAPSITA